MARRTAENLDEGGRRDSNDSTSPPFKLIKDLVGAVNGGNPNRSEGEGREVARILKSR